ncbi:MAG: CusA/CzcA family heavy metal efflux RND transporter [Cytophagales bacterium]|nr:CusA/CzcA family heavy metal efflux RND transporter [Cytophagales bacterium]MDW8384156.1 CusA/CzcA family heavy metal efflux RND transporter [Flammeovirgaceae bacterium]
MILSYMIYFSVRNKLVIGLLVAVLLIYGSYQLAKLPIDAVPDITNNQVQIITTAPFFGAEDIERLVTYPIEFAVRNIPHVIELRSFSRFGLSLITIVFEDDIDIYWARQQVSERLQQIQSQIPSQVGKPELAPITTGLGEIYQYVIKPKKGYENQYDIITLRTLQDWIVRRQLLGVEGVADVSSFGGKVKQYQISLFPQKLHALGISVQDVLDALESNNENTGGAYIEKNAIALYVRTEGLVTSVADIEKIVIPVPNREMPLFLRDVAEIKISHAIRYGALCYNDEGEVAGGIVLMLKGENSSQVVKKVKKRIEQIQKMLPEGVIIEPFLDRTKMVHQAIRTVETNLIEGALIVVLVLVLFLGNWRAGILVGSVIPLAMLFAICMMNLFGVSGNLMSLGALDFGLIVDGAVIIVEAVMYRLSHSGVLSHQLSKNELVVEVATSIMKSAVFGQLIILIVYLPIFALHGIEGKMFKPMAQTVVFALIGAFLLSFTYVPMMCAWFLPNAAHTSFADSFFDSLRRFYRLLLLKTLRFGKYVLVGVLIVGTWAFWIALNLGGEFIPVLEEGDFAVDTKVLAGSNLNTTIQATQQAARILKERFPEVEKVVTKIGSGEIPIDPMPMNAADMMVILKEKSKWESARTFAELEKKMSQCLAEIPGITVGFQFPVQMRFNELLTGARQDIVCKIFGTNLDTLVRLSERLSELVRRVEGATDVYVEPVAGIPQVVISIDRAMLAHYRLSVQKVNHIVNTAFAGRQVGWFYEGEKRFEIVVRLADSARKNFEDIQKLLIPTPIGVQVPLYQVAQISFKESANQIQHENTQRRVFVGFNVRNRDTESILKDLISLVEKELPLPEGYTIEYGGNFENLQAAKARLVVAVPIALLLIFILLYSAFQSFRYSVLIYTAIPFAAIGGIFSLGVRQMPFSISAGVGFIALFGVAVLNGIVLIASFQQIKHLQTVSYRVLYGATSRLRPVLMTALVASLGFLPMALSKGAGAEVQRPLATVVIGGLVTSTLLTLFILPLLYTLFQKKLFKISSHMNVLGLIVVILLSSACTKNTHKSNEEPSESHFSDIVTLSQVQIERAGIVVGNISRKPINAVLQMNGIIEVPPQNLISISVPIGGYVKSIRPIVGAKVKKGDTLAVLEDLDYITLQQEYLVVTAQLFAIEEEYLRQEKLFQEQIGGKKDFQQAKASYLAQKALQKSLQEKLRLLGVRYQTLSENNLTASIPILSPSNGYITEVNVNVGKYANPSDVIFKIVNTEDIHLVVHVLEKDINKLDIGQQIWAYTNYAPEKKYRCRVIQIAMSITSERTFPVHCHFERYESTLLPGMYMNVEVPIQKGEYYAVPSEAVVRFDGKDQIFYQISPNTFQMKEIKVIHNEKDFTALSWQNVPFLDTQNVVLKGAYTLLMALKNNESP